MEEPGRLQSMGSLRVGHDWATSLSLFTSMQWGRKCNPLQCSCLENPRDGGAWWAAVYGVAQSRTQLKRLSSSSSSSIFLSAMVTSKVLDVGCSVSLVSEWGYRAEPPGNLQEQCSVNEKWIFTVTRPWKWGLLLLQQKPSYPDWYSLVIGPRNWTIEIFVL